MSETLVCDGATDAPDAMICGATLLRHNFLLMTKQFRADGEAIGYSLGKFFDMSTVVLRGLDRVYDMLDGMQDLTSMCIIRGELINPSRIPSFPNLSMKSIIYGARSMRLIHLILLTFPEMRGWLRINPPRVFHQRRLLAKKGDGGISTLKDVARRWASFDFDSIAAPDDLDRRDLVACARVAAQLLPKEFHGCRALVHATSSHMVKPGLRVRLWYWLDRPTFGYELKRWIGKRVSDHSVLNAIEPIYCAAPLFENPAMNPLKERLAELPGLPVVHVPAATTLAPKSRPGANRAPVKVPDIDDIRDLVYAVASQAEGNRNNNLFGCACKIGNAVALGRMGHQQAFDVLVDAALHSGLERQEAEATVSSGLQAGIHAITAAADPFEDAANTFTAEIPDAEVR